MRLVFLGTPAAAVPSLQALIAAGHSVARVVTQPDRPAGRSGRPQPPPVKVVALAAGLEVMQPERVRTRAFRLELAAVEPEVLVVVAYGRILGPRLLVEPPRGAINLHFSLLPAYRGAAPVQWALARGEPVTGVTTMQMNEHLDEGALLLQREVVVEPRERARALSARLAEIGATLLVETLRRVEDGSVTPRPQDPAGVSFAPRLRVEDGEVSPEMTAPTIEARMRGFDPWPGVWMRPGGRRTRIVDARARAGGGAAAPGTLVEAVGGGLALSCAGGTELHLLEVQPQGRRVMGVADALNGRLLRPGDRLDRPAPPNLSEPPDDATPPQA